MDKNTMGKKTMGEGDTLSLFPESDYLGEQVLGKMVEPYRGKVQRPTHIQLNRTAYSLYKNLFWGLTKDIYHNMKNPHELIEELNKENPQREGETKKEYKDRLWEQLKNLPYGYKTGGGIEKWVPEQNGWVSIPNSFVISYIENTTEGAFNYEFFDVLWEIVFKRLMSYWDFGDGKRVRYFHGMGYKWIKVSMGELVKRLSKMNQTETERKLLYRRIHNAFNYWSQIRVRWSDIPDIVKSNGIEYKGKGSYGYLAPFITQYGYNEHLSLYTITLSEMWFIGTHAFELPAGMKVKHDFFTPPKPALMAGGVDAPPEVKHFVSVLLAMPDFKGRKFQRAGIKHIKQPMNYFYRYTGLKGVEDYEQVKKVAWLCSKVVGLTTTPQLDIDNKGIPLFRGKVRGEDIIEIFLDLGRIPAPKKRGKIGG